MSFSDLSTVIRVLFYIVPAMLLVCCCIVCAVIRERRQIANANRNNRNQRIVAQNRIQYYGSMDTYSPPPYTESLAQNYADQLPSYESIVQKLANESTQ